MVNFFVSYATVDSDWAEWVAWQLEEAGYSVIIQEWDFVPGSNFVLEIHRATISAQRTIAILTHDYLQRLYTQSEWAAAFGRDPDSSQRTLIPIRVLPCTPMGLLSQIAYIDLVGRSEERARELLLKKVSVEQRRLKPQTEPRYPGAPSHSVEKPERYPGSPGHKERQEEPTRNLIHAQLTARGLVDVDFSSNPYGLYLDATDDVSAMKGKRVHASVWLPGPQYLRSSNLEKFTTAAAICVTNPTEVVSRSKTYLEASFPRLLGKLPSNMLNEEREQVLSCMGYVLKDCLLVAVAFPEVILRVGQKRPQLAYQAMADLFLFPLLDLHRRFLFEELDIHLGRVGEKMDGDLQRLSKQGLKSLFPKKGTAEIHLVEPKSDQEVLVWFSRVLSWAVGAYYNSGKPKWIHFLEENLES